MAGGRTFLIRLFADSKDAEQGFKKVADVAGGFDKKMLLVGGAIAGVFAAIVGGAYKAGKALLDLGEEFDSAFDRIRIGTGATGAAFESLQQSFRDVAASVPQSFGTTAGALADLATRTNLTGEQLETMTERTLTLARLLDQDVSGIIVSTSKVFNRFNLSYAEQLDFLDLLLRANQATGASVEGLAQQVLDGKSALDRLGLTLDEQVALLASFEREGVPAEKIIGAITRGVANFAKEGQPAAAALRAVFDEIRAAPTGDDADAIGQRIFGSRGFAQVVDAVRDGALEIDDILATLRDGDTIMGLAEETDDLAESWDTFKNFLKLQFEPIATSVFNNATGLIEQLQPAVTRVKDAFEKEGLNGAMEQLSKEWDSIYNNPEFGIKALWEKFLKFLREIVLPAAKELATEIGAALFDGIVKGATDALKEVGAGKYEFSTRSAQIALSQRTILPSTSTSSSGSTYLRPMADGGPVSLGRPYLIGEEGPELFVPNRMGTIVPNSGMGGGNVYVTVTGAIDPEGTARTIIRVLEDAQRRSGVRLAV